MDRRTFLATAGGVLSVSFAGCIVDGDDLGSDVKERVKECEKQYIRNKIIREYETLDNSLHPSVENAESREDGEFVELETPFGASGEQGDHADYLVNAYYLVTDDTVYRTEGVVPDGDPRDGATVDC